MKSSQQTRDKHKNVRQFHVDPFIHSASRVFRLLVTTSTSSSGKDTPCVGKTSRFILYPFRVKTEKKYKSLPS